MRGHFSWVTKKKKRKKEERYESRALLKRFARERSLPEVRKVSITAKEFGVRSRRGFAGSFALSRRKLCFPRVPVGRQFRPKGRKSSPRLRAVYTAVNQLIASPLLLSRFSFSLSLLPASYRKDAFVTPIFGDQSRHLFVFLSPLPPGSLPLLPTTRKSVLLGR